MDETEIKNCLGEIELVMQDPTLIGKNGFTFEEFLSVNEFKIMVLCFYHFHLYPVNKRLLELSLDAKDCDNYDFIYELISDKWLEHANVEIEKYIKELESTPIE